MTQIENEIYTEIRNLVLAEYSTAFVSGEYTPIPQSFPCVFVEEIDNTTASLNGSNQGEVANVSFEINVFSNLANGRKTQCKKIINLIDEHMTVRGFTRTMCMRVPNADTTIYRMTARYTAQIYNETIYRS